MFICHDPILFDSLPVVIYMARQHHGFSMIMPQFVSPGLAKNTILWKNPVLAGFYGLIRIKSCVFSNIVFFQKRFLPYYKHYEIMIYMRKDNYACILPFPLTVKSTKYEVSSCVIASGALLKLLVQPIIMLLSSTQLLKLSHVYTNFSTDMYPQYFYFWLPFLNDSAIMGPQFRVYVITLFRSPLMIIAFVNMLWYLFLFWGGK